MDIYSWVKKHERKIFIGLTILIGGSFLITYQFLFVLEKMKESAPAGYIFGHKVKKRDFYLTKLYWNNLISIISQRMFLSPIALLNIYGILEDDEIEKDETKTRFTSRMLLKNKGVWKILVLLKHAEDKKVYITQKELSDKIKQIFGNDLDLLLQESQLSKDKFLETFKQYMIVMKFIDFYTHQSKPGGLNEAFEFYKDENKTIKLSYVLYDIKKQIQYLKKISPIKKADFINKTFPKWNPKEEIKLRLLYFVHEDLKKTIPKPTEEEKQKYYEENKKEFIEKTEAGKGKEKKEIYKPYNAPEVQKKIEDTLVEKALNELIDRKIEELQKYLFFHADKFSNSDFLELKNKFKIDYKETDYFPYDEFPSLGLGDSSNLVKKELPKAVVSMKFKKFTTTGTNKVSGLYQVIGKKRLKTPGYFFLNKIGKMKVSYQTNFEEYALKLEELPKKIITKTKELYDILYIKYNQELKSKGPLHERYLSQALKKEAFYKILDEHKIKDTKITTFKYDSDLKIKGISFNEVTSKAKSLDIGDYDYVCVAKPHYVCIIFIIDEKIDPDPKDFIDKKDEYLSKSLFSYTKEQIKKLYLSTLMEMAKLDSKVPIDKNDKANDYGEFR